MIMIHENYRLVGSDSGIGVKVKVKAIPVTGHEGP
jgi:hypothetical protein